jgi:hypothetical protein
LRTQFAPKATDDELAYFAQVARHLELDPWAGHICLVPYRGVHRPQLTVAGRRFIAQRTGRWRGLAGPQWCGPDRTEDGQHLWLDVWDDPDNYPYAARCFAYVADWVAPANGTVRWAEFAQWWRPARNEPEELLATWAKMPAHMLGKVAESLALRRAFPEVQAAIAYTGDVDEDAILIAEADAPELPDPGPAAPVTPPSAPAARGRARTRGDSPPPEFYDNLPEAQTSEPGGERYDPADPERPFA